MRTILMLLLALAVAPVAPAQEATPPVAAEAAGFDHAHAAFDAVLKAYVHEGGLVDYQGLAKDRAGLDDYVTGLEAVTAAEFRAWSGIQREAFWINAYNAYTLQLILDNLPVKSIRDLGGLFSSVFSKRFIPLQHLAKVDPRGKAGTRKKLSLGEVEHDILFPVSRTPLFHFAIVCASWSCPELRAEAYVADRLDEQLEEQARVFLADVSKNDLRVRDGRLRISRIFDWSGDEFATYPGGTRQLLRDYGPASLAEDPALGKAKLRYRDYDWALNVWTAPEGKDDRP